MYTLDLDHSVKLKSVHGKFDLDDATRDLKQKKISQKFDRYTWYTDIKTNYLKSDLGNKSIYHNS